jgi:hypothetical protein
MARHPLVRVDRQYSSKSRRTRQIRHRHRNENAAMPSLDTHRGERFCLAARYERLQRWLLQTSCACCKRCEVHRSSLFDGLDNSVACSRRCRISADHPRDPAAAARSPRAASLRTSASTKALYQQHSTCTDHSCSRLSVRRHCDKMMARSSRRAAAGSGARCRDAV